MKRILIFCALFLSACCTTDKCLAIDGANLLYEAGIADAEALRLGCTERYRVVTSEEEMARLDVKCLPAAGAYAALRIQHARLVSAIAGNGQDLAEVLAAAQEASLQMVKLLEEIK